MYRCMCGSKPVIKKHENGKAEIYCINCTRPHAYDDTRREAKKEWNRLCKAEREHWNQHHMVTGN